jgi:hypothetical protein
MTEARGRGPESRERGMSPPWTLDRITVPHAGSSGQRRGVWCTQDATPHRSPPAQAGGTAGRWAVQLPIATPRSPPTRPIRGHNQPARGCPAGGTAGRWAIPAPGSPRDRPPRTRPIRVSSSDSPSGQSPEVLREAVSVSAVSVEWTRVGVSGCERLLRLPGAGTAGHPQSPRLAPGGFYWPARGPPPLRSDIAAPTACVEQHRGWRPARGPTESRGPSVRRLAQASL